MLSKQDYLEALTKEIEAPNDGHLDAYLQPFIGAQIPRENAVPFVETDAEIF